MLNLDQEGQSIESFSKRLKLKFHAIALGIALLFGKFKVLLPLLKFLKLGKAGGTLLSMFLMILTYARSHGWSFGTGFVFLILGHELGHGYAARRVGLPVGAPVFIPFFGAFIAMKEKPKTSYDEFLVALGGPLAGTAAGLLCVATSGFLSSEWAKLSLVLGFSALTMNLFNLLPVLFLDGRRMTSVLSSFEWGLGLAFLGLCAYLSRENTLNPIAGLVMVVCAIQVVYSMFNSKQKECTPEERLVIFFGYFGLTGFLVFFTGISSTYL